MGGPINTPTNRTGFIGGSSLGDILTALKNGVVGVNNLVDGVGSLSPHFTSGQVSAAALIQTGFVRLTGLSIVTGTVAGVLNDAATLADATTDNVVYNVPASAGLPASSGYIAVNMVFKNGLVFQPGADQKAALFYTRT